MNDGPDNAPVLHVLTTDYPSTILHPIPFQCLLIFFHLQTTANRYTPQLNVGTQQAMLFQ